MKEYKYIEEDKKYREDKQLRDIQTTSMIIVEILSIYTIGLYVKEYYPVIKQEINIIEGELEKIISK